jgi:hypothetical protein
MAEDEDGNSVSSGDSGYNAKDERTVAKNKERKTKKKRKTKEDHDDDNSRKLEANIAGQFLGNYGTISQESHYVLSTFGAEVQAGGTEANPG